MEVWQHSVYGMGLGDTVRTVWGRRCREGFAVIMKQGIGRVSRTFLMLTIFIVTLGGIAKVTFRPYF